MESLSCWIWFLSCEPTRRTSPPRVSRDAPPRRSLARLSRAARAPSLVVMEHEMTGRETPQERPSAFWGSGGVMEKRGEAAGRRGGGPRGRPGACLLAGGDRRRGGGPRGRPGACLFGTKTYGTFLSSHSSGRCSRISSGSASAACDAGRGHAGVVVGGGGSARQRERGGAAEAGRGGGCSPGQSARRCRG